MDETHDVYLSLGSNIDPENNLPRAIEMLRLYGRVKDISGVWESHAVGSDGPNFLNASVSLETQMMAIDYVSTCVEHNQEVSQ